MINQNKLYHCIGVFLLCTASCIAQFANDSNDFKIAIKPFLGFDRLIKNTNNQTINVPDKLVSLRQSRYEGEGYAYEASRYVDFPQTHFTFFGGVNFRTSYQDFLKVDIAFIGENQSSSFGVLGFDDFVVYPRLILRYEDGMPFLGDSISLSAVVGDLIQYRHRAGLIIYNVDAQGGDLKLSYRNFYYGFTSIADLSQHIGLKIEEVYSHRLGYTHKSPDHSFNYDFGLSVDIMSYSTMNLFYQISVFPGVFFSAKGEGNFEIYAELGFRNLNEFVPENTTIGRPPAYFYTPTTIENTALLAGVYNGWKIRNKHKLNFRAEGRFYGRGYTKFLHSYGLRYRENYGDYQGEYLYPLMNAYRPFNQFAVYSEFQDISVMGLNLQFKSLWKLYKKLNWRADIEIQGLHTLENDFLEKPFVYYFYETGIVYQLTKGIEASFFISNKVMNLDLSYQTFYQSNLPLIGYAIRSELPF